MSRFWMRDDGKFRGRSRDYVRGIFHYISPEDTIASRIQNGMRVFKKTKSPQAAFGGVAATMYARVVASLVRSPGYGLRDAPSGSQHGGKQRNFVLSKDTA